LAFDFFSFIESSLARWNEGRFSPKNPFYFPVMGNFFLPRFGDEIQGGGQVYTIAILYDFGKHQLISNQKKISNSSFRPQNLPHPRYINYYHSLAKTSVTGEGDLTASDSLLSWT
jgi:hypothetical protein